MTPEVQLALIALMGTLITGAVTVSMAALAYRRGRNIDNSQKTEYFYDEAAGRAALRTKEMERTETLTGPQKLEKATDFFQETVARHDAIADIPRAAAKRIIEAALPEALPDREPQTPTDPKEPSVVDPPEDEDPL